jgi:polysaccharide export outer membrane protein
MAITRFLVLIALFGLATTISAEDGYRLNPGDILRISVWNEEALQQEVMVLPDGTISFPLVGIIKVQNRSPEQVQVELKEKLSRLIPDPEINLSVQAVNGNSFFIIGKVNSAGRFEMTRPIDVMQTLSLAGGLTPYADSENIQILRRTGSNQKIIKFDYTRFTKGKSLETNILLRSGDTIVVP